MELKYLIPIFYLFTNVSFAQNDALVEHIDRMNEQLASEGQSVAIYSMELIGSGKGLNMGRTVLASNHGNKQLGVDWSLNDPNRLDANGNPRTNITYAIDTAEFTSDFLGHEQPDIVRFGLETWDKQKCSNIGIDEVPAPAPPAPAQIAFRSLAPVGEQIDVKKDATPKAVHQHVDAAICEAEDCIPPTQGLAAFTASTKTAQSALFADCDFATESIMEQLASTLQSKSSSRRVRRARQIF